MREQKGDKGEGKWGLIRGGWDSITHNSFPPAGEERPEGTGSIPNCGKDYHIYSKPKNKNFI